jgi:heptosyltransferase-3
MKRRPHRNPGGCRNNVPTDSDSSSIRAAAAQSRCRHILSDAVMTTIRMIRSAIKLMSIVVQQLFASLHSAASGDPQTAQDYLRSAALFIHDDLVQIIVALQRVVLRSKRLPAKVDRILIVKLDRIGDMVNVGPVLDALLSRFPGVRLDIVGHPVPLSLLDGDRRVDEQLCYKSSLYHALPLCPPGPRSWRLLLTLLSRRYSLVVYLRGSILFLPLGLTSRLTATKFVENEHVIDRYMKPIEQLLGAVPERQLRLHVRPEAAREARSLLSDQRSSCRRKIAIHAGASAATKMWPAERFSELADRLASRWEAQVHFLGNAADRAHLEAIARRAREAHFYHDSLRLPTTVALIAECDLFIGNDSGLSHIAAAVGTPLVVIWGPAALSSARPAARTDAIQILYHELPCRATCPEIKCTSSIHLECLMRTEVHDVVTAASYFLGAPSELRKAAVSADAATAVDAAVRTCHP